MSLGVTVQIPPGERARKGVLTDDAPAPRVATRRYRLTPARRLINDLTTALLRTGIRVDGIHLLTVAGNRSGKERTTPVVVVEEDGQRWIVAPYGEVGWVKNVRAAGAVRLTRGRRSITAPVVEVGPNESAPVLRKYVSLGWSTRPTLPYFSATPDSPLDVFAAEASRHPVFRLVDSRRDSGLNSPTRWADPRARIERTR